MKATPLEDPRRTARERRPRRRRRLAAAALLAHVSVLALAFVFDSSARPAPPPASPPAPAAEVARQEGASRFTSFSHATPAHREASCDSCHGRADNSAAPRLPGHRACTDCHLQQFVAAPDLPMCAICHTDLGQRNPPVKGFPALRSFNARFDHAQHTAGAGRSERGCAACHAPARRGVALSIPAGLDAHARCYECHTPGASAAGRDISSCGTCHQLGAYARTPASAPAFRVGFSHAAHGPRQGLDCASCHAVTAGLPQSRQVSSPRPSQHFPPPRAPSCATCHDNRRAFGGDDFGDCRRCHTGRTFRF